jgi:hypothetical protein
MPFPMLPLPAPGEVLLVNTCYEADGIVMWNEVLQTLGGRRDGDAIVLGETDTDTDTDTGTGTEITLRLTEHPDWDYLHAGDFPALRPPDFNASVIVQADISAVYGGDAPLLVDLREVPGRGVRIPPERLAVILTSLHAGTITFNELIRGMDLCGTYLGDAGAPMNPTPTDVIRTDYPQLPLCPSGTLLVRTDFDNAEGWTSLLSSLGTLDEDGYPQPDADDTDPSDVDLFACVIDDPTFESLQPGQVPALIPTITKDAQHTTMVALADARTLADPAHHLLVVDLYDTSGQSIRISLSGAGAMAINLEIANMDFHEFENYDDWSH